MQKWQPLKPAVYKTEVPKEFQSLAVKELWINDLYTVAVKRGIDIGEGFSMAWLSIKRNDKAPAKDWRHFQLIKNQLVGENCEGCELYPAENRLVDGSNQYHLWVFENSAMKFPFGFTDGRFVSRHALEGGKQQGWHKDDLPKDIDECEARVKQAFDNLKKESLPHPQETLQGHFKPDAG